MNSITISQIVLAVSFCSTALAIWNFGRVMGWWS